MIDETSQRRLESFFEEIRDHSSFMDCKSVGVHTRGFQGETPLKIAVVRENHELVSDLLKAGADPNLPGEDDYTPLHHAVVGGNLQIVQLLMAYRATPSLVNIYGQTPLDYAISDGRKEMLDLIKKDTI